MQARPFLLLICLAVLSVAAFSLVRKREHLHAFGPDDASGLSSLLMTPEAVAALADLSETEFRRSLLESANALRAKRGYRPLSPDPRLEQWLNRRPLITCDNLEASLAAAEFPEFQSVRAVGIAGRALRDLLPRHLDNLSLPASDQEDRCGILIRSLPDQGCEVIVLTGKSLPELSLASLGDGSGGAFVSTCPHCGKKTAFHNEKTPSTLSLTCSACGRGIRLLGRDTKGRYHDASAFLIPSASPSPPPGSHPLDAMISIWQNAVRRCQYVEDGEEGGETADFWQTPRQTLQKGTGDCEDSALLLTDWMLANNIPARMAMGTLKDGGHAWCIVRVAGTDYLLESTNRNPDLENLPAVNPRDGYVPTALVDRDALYVRADPGKPFDGDYWSPQKWIRLPRAKAAPAKTAPVPKNVALKP